MKVWTQRSRLSVALCGFTLVEILGALVIIVVLMLSMIRVVSYTQRKAAESRVQAEIKTMELAIEAFKIDNGYYPTSSPSRSCSSGGYGAMSNTYLAVMNSSMLLNQLTSPKVYLRFRPNQLRSNLVVWCGISNVYACIIDPWGTPYNYVCTRPPLPVDSTGTTGQMNSTSFDLWSYGVDLLNNTADDVANWKR